MGRSESTRSWQHPGLVTIIPITKIDSWRNLIVLLLSQGLFGWLQSYVRATVGHWVPVIAGLGVCQCAVSSGEGGRGLPLKSDVSQHHNSNSSRATAAAALQRLNSNPRCCGGRAGWGSGRGIRRTPACSQWGEGPGYRRTRGNVTQGAVRAWQLVTCIELPCLMLYV